MKVLRERLKPSKSYDYSHFQSTQYAWHLVSNAKRGWRNLDRILLFLGWRGKIYLHTRCQNPVSDKLSAITPSLRLVVQLPLDSLF